MVYISANRFHWFSMAIIELHSEFFRARRCCSGHVLIAAKFRCLPSASAAAFLAVTWAFSDTGFFDWHRPWLLARRTCGHAFLFFGQGLRAFHYSCKAARPCRASSASYPRLLYVDHGAVFQLHAKIAAASIPFCLAIWLWRIFHQRLRRLISLTRGFFGLRFSGDDFWLFCGVSASETNAQFINFFFTLGAHCFVYQLRCAPNESHRAIHVFSCSSSLFSRRAL